MRKAIQYYSCTVCYLLPHVVLLLLLPHAVQFATGCRTPYSLLFIVAHRRVAFVAVCFTVCCLLLHAVQSAIWCRTPYSCFLLPHAVQFAACCHMLYNLLFVAVPYSCFCCRTLYSCFWLPHAVQFAICCRAL